MKQTLAQSFARAIKAARRARGFTQAELSERVGMAVEAYGRLERGNTLPRADTLAALAQVLAVTTDELLGRTEAPLVARDSSSVESADPDLRRIVELVESFTPATRRAVLTALRAVATDGARAGKPGRRPRRA